MKNLVLCISEMAPSLLEKWIADLPNFAALQEQGTAGTTKYCCPFLLTPQMWATVTTGLSAGHHGVFDYWQRSDTKGDFAETNGGNVDGQRFWQVLDDQGVKTCIANLPHTHPPTPMRHGVLFSGQDAPGAHSSIASPASAYKTITEKLGRYHHKDIFPGGQERIEYAGTIVKETEWQAGLFEFLFQEYEPDFMMCYASGAAMAQHYFWGDIDDSDAPKDCQEVVYKTYRALDEMLGRLRAVAGSETNIWVMSECGAGPIKSGIDINRWLHEEGFLTFNKQESQKSGGLDRKILSAARMAAQRFLPKQGFHLVNRPFIRRFIQNRMATSEIDWSQTRAYHRGKGEGAIYLNLHGREPDGVVPRDQGAAILKEIGKKLLQLKDPETGELVVNSVHQGEDLYKGPHRGRAPDLVVEWADHAYMPTEAATSGNKVFVPRMREYMSWATTGSHRPEGVFIAAGPGIERGKLTESVRLLDLAPTWLAAMGAKPSSDFQGEVARKILRTEKAVSSV